MDVSEARRWIHIFLPEGQVGKLARFCRTMCGMREATLIWERSDVLKESSMKVGPPFLLQYLEGIVSWR